MGLNEDLGSVAMGGRGLTLLVAFEIAARSFAAAPAVLVVHNRSDAPIAL